MTGLIKNVSLHRQLSTCLLTPTPIKNPKKADKSKTKRFTWWQDFIDQVGSVHLIKTTTKKTDMSTCRDSFNWLDKMASKTLATIFHLLGNNRFIAYIYKLVSLGESKLTPQDKQKIDYLKDNIEHLNFDY